MGERQDLPRRPEPAPALRDLRRVRGLSHKRRREGHERDHREGRRRQEAGRGDGRPRGMHGRRRDMGGGAGRDLGVEGRPGGAHPPAHARALGVPDVLLALGRENQARPRPRDLSRGAGLLERRRAEPRHRARPPRTGDSGLDARRALRRHGDPRRRGRLPVRPLRRPAFAGAPRLWAAPLGRGRSPHPTTTRCPSRVVRSPPAFAPLWGTAPAAEACGGMCGAARGDCLLGGPAESGGAATPPGVS